MSHISATILPSASLAGRAAASLTVIAGALLAWQAWNPWPFEIAGLRIDRLTTLVLLFISIIGGVTVRFAGRSMQGHVRRDAFLRLLGAALFAATLVAAGSSLPLLAAGWILLGVCVTALVGFERQSARAMQAARRHAVVSRISDVCLLAAFGLMAWRGRTLDLSGFLEVTPGLQQQDLLPIAVLVSVAAIARSAQIPFHLWLPASAEAPTPVSALLHAGIINAGGLLLVRTAPLIVRVPEAWILLSVAGSLAIAVAMLVAWHQWRVKHALAWSTIAQMGFMIVQCAVAAFPAALLHMLGHGAYKALAFLGSGERPRVVQSVSRAWTGLVALCLGAISAVACMPIATWLTGFDPAHSPGELALSGVIALSVGQLWGLLLARSHRLVAASLALAASVVAPMGCFALYRGMSDFLAPVHGALPVPSGPAAWFAAGLPFAVLAALSALHASRSLLEGGLAWRWLRVQAREGFHGDVLAGRLADSIRNPPKPDRRDLIHA
jgi:NADH:ubiquinone oxidoreductase subunit 2 (subunit N)